MNIGEKIKQLRIQNGLTLEQLGNKVGVGKSTVRKWECGIIQNMKRDKIANLAEALNTTPAYLMGWETEIKEAADWIGSIEQAVAILKIHKDRNKYLIELLKAIYNLPEEYQIRILGLAISLKDSYELELKELGIKQFDPKTQKFLDWD